LPDYLSLYISETEWPSLKMIDQFFMIKAELIKDGGLYIKRADFVLDAAISNLIGYTK